MNEEPAETAIALKLCPVCASIAEKRGGYDWGKVGCSSWDCPIRSIAFYPERWNDRPLEENLQAQTKALMDAVAIYGGRINKATAYLHGLSVFSDDVKSAELKEAIEILEGNV